MNPTPAYDITQFSKDLSAGKYANQVPTTPTTKPGGLTDNQVHAIYNNQLGRDATPYELSTSKNASIQTLANLKDTYSKLDPNSIVDYLKSVGQDSSMANRQALGAQYGITNIGTAEGNTALLNALKSGKAPAAPTTVSGAIGGTQAPATTAPASDQAQATPTTTTPDTTTGTTTGAPTDVSTLKDAYTTAQNGVLDVTNQLNEINNQIAGALQAKKDEVARSGGVVDEAQLRSIVLAEQAPLIAERNNLQAQRTQLVGEQSMAGKAYQDAIKQAQFTQTEADKAAQLKLAQQKQTAQESQFATKTGIQQQQFEQKLAQSGIKKISDYQDGTKVGEHYVNTAGKTVNVNPATGELIGTGNTIGGSVANPNGTSYTGTNKGGVNFSDFYVSGDAPTEENGKQIDPKTGISLDGIYQATLESLSTGKMPSIGLGTKPKPVAIRSAILNMQGAMARKLGVTVPQIQALYAGDKKAAANAIDRVTKIDTISSSLTSQFPRLAELAAKVGDMGITESDLSAGKAAAARKFGSVDAGNYIELVQTVRSDYAAMQAAVAGGRGGQFFAANAQDAIPLGLTPDQYKGLQQTIDQSAKNASTAVRQGVANIFGNIPGAVSGQGSQTQTPTAPPADWLTNYNYDADIAAAKDAISRGAPVDAVRAQLLTKYKDVNL